MDAKWVETRNAEAFEKYRADVLRVADYIGNVPREMNRIGDSPDAEKVAQAAELLVSGEVNTLDYQELAFALYGVLAFNEHAREVLGDKFCEDMSSMTAFNPNAFDVYLDYSFELPVGDYIVTDPCYIELKEPDVGLPQPPRWWSDEFAQAMPSLRQRNTMYGDWGCTMFDVSGKELDDMDDDERQKAIVGYFCADAGQVCIVRADEVRAYNESFLNQLEKDLSAEGNEVCNYACLIRDFEGRGSFEVRETVYELDGENRFGYDVVVVLEGKNSRTGENVRYESRQTFL